MSSAESLPPALHERTDGAPGVIVLAGCALAVGIAAALLAAAWFYTARYAGLPPTRTYDAASSFRHGPEERSGIARDWEQQDAAVRRHLESYAWIDREAGIVRIPVERAMELLAADAETEAAP